MSFRRVFLAVVIAFALILGAFLINRARPKVETEQPSAEFARATGKCLAPLLFPNFVLLGLIALRQLGIRSASKV